MAYAGVSGRFGMGLQNPQGNRLTAPASRGPRVLPMQPGQQTAPLQPTGRATPGATQPVASPQMGQYDYAVPKPSGTVVGRGGAFDYLPVGGPVNANAAYLGGPQQQGPKPIGLDEPGIPGSANLATASTADFVGGQYTGYDPTKWEQPEIDIPDAGVDTRKVVDSTKHFLDEEMAGGMAETARRFGALGGLRSSGYMGSLGNLERKRDLDLASAYYKYDYDAAQSDANRRSAARENTLNRAFQGWGKYEDLLSGEASRKTNFSQTESDRATRNDQFNAGNETNVSISNAGALNNFDWNRYGAELSAAQRQQIYQQLLEEYGQ